MLDERAKRMQAEIVVLWSETFGEQPSVRADPQTMIRILVECLEDVGPWDVSEGPVLVRRSVGP